MTENWKACYQGNGSLSLENDIHSEIILGTGTANEEHYHSPSLVVPMPRMISGILFKAFFLNKNHEW